MSAEVTTRTCLGCRRDYTYIGWRLDALCPSCREEETARDLARTRCVKCRGPLTPAPNRRLCDDCFHAETIAAIEKWGAE